MEDLAQLLAEVSRELAEYRVRCAAEEEVCEVMVDGQYVGDFLIEAKTPVKVAYNLMERIRIALAKYGEVNGTAEEGFYCD